MNNNDVERTSMPFDLDVLKMTLFDYDLQSDQTNLEVTSFCRLRFPRARSTREPQTKEMLEEPKRDLISEGVIESGFIITQRGAVRYSIRRL